MAKFQTTAAMARSMSSTVSWESSSVPNFVRAMNGSATVVSPPWGLLLRFT